MSPKPKHGQHLKRSASARLKQGGFNMIELIMAIAILAILVALAVPSMQWLIVSNRLTGSANEVLTGIQSARMEAIRLNRRVVMCRSSNADSPAPTCDAGAGQWSGWIVFVDDGGATPANARNGTFNAGEQLIRVGSMPGDNTGLIPSPAIETDSAQAITFRPDGMARESATSSVLLTAQFSVCEDTTSVDENARFVTIASGGRSAVRKGTSSGCAAPTNVP
jgi:type IV fimbrial biogenesis protein FimT